MQTRATTIVTTHSTQWKTAGANRVLASASRWVIRNPPTKQIGTATTLTKRRDLKPGRNVATAKTAGTNNAIATVPRLCHASAKIAVNEFRRRTIWAIPTPAKSVVNGLKTQKPRGNEYQGPR